MNFKSAKINLKNMSSQGEVASSSTLHLNDPCFNCTPHMDRSNTILQATAIASNMGVIDTDQKST